MIEWFHAEYDERTEIDSMTVSLKLWQRAALLIIFPLICVLGFTYIYYGHRGMLCLFYESTGYYCPGCGSGRAVWSLLHGDWKGAFRHNLLLLPLGIPAAVVFLHEYIRLVFPGTRLKPIFVPQWLATGCVVLVFLFWILRNLSPFAFLAP